MVFDINDLKDVREFFKGCSFLSPWSSPEQLPKKQVVTCFLQRGDKILALQRGKDDEQYSLWGIPGGKLDPSETLLEGLSREIFEETGAVLTDTCFTYLGSALSKTATDGFYGLHLYHAHFPKDLNGPVVNTDEHLAFQWVTIEEFNKLQLLHAQREAFFFVYFKLMDIINNGIKNV